MSVRHTLLCLKHLKKNQFVVIIISIFRMFKLYNVELCTMHTLILYTLPK